MEELENTAYRYFSRSKVSFKTIGISITRCSCYFFIPPSFITYLAIPFTFWSSCDSVSSVQIDYKGSWCSSLQLTSAVNKNQEYQDMPVLSSWLTGSSGHSAGEGASSDSLTLLYCPHHWTMSEFWLKVQIQDLILK